MRVPIVNKKITGEKRKRENGNFTAGYKEEVQLVTLRRDGRETPSQNTAELDKGDMIMSALLFVPYTEEGRLWERNSNEINILPNNVLPQFNTKEDIGNQWETKFSIRLQTEKSPNYYRDTYFW